MAAAITSSTGCLVDRRAGPAPIRRARPASAAYQWPFQLALSARRQTVKRRRRVRRRFSLGTSRAEVVQAGGLPPFTGPLTIHTHFTDNIVRVGLNYRFGGPYSSFNNDPGQCTEDFCLVRALFLNVRYWHKADIRLCTQMSAFGGKADIAGLTATLSD